MNSTSNPFEQSTRTMVKNLKSNQPLHTAMRGGLVVLTNHLLIDMPRIRSLDTSEQGVEMIDQIATLAEGWNHVVDAMDYRGRDFKDGYTAEDLARIQYLLSLSYALGAYVLEETNEKDLTGLSYGLGEYVLKCTQTKI